MLLLFQTISFVFVFYLVLFNISSISSKENFDTSLRFFSTNDSLTSSFSRFFKTQQQLHSKFPNFNEELRELSIGDLNFLHTTDTHGWYLGHLNQRQYSSDWGDFVSFHLNLKQLINDQGGDLLLVDTGDKHDGNGLSDLTTPNGVLSDEIFMNAEYDLVTVGNHELYVAEISQYEFENVVPRYGDRFISTNVEYLTDNDEFVTFGNSKYRYFETDVNHYKVFSLSFMFDFKGGNERVKVTPVAELIHQKWFLDLLKEYSETKEVDILVIFGHLPVSHEWEEMYWLHTVLRQYFPDTVIQYFGGHSHIRDFSIVDEISTGLQSGRYCETIGFLSLNNFTDVEDKANFVYNKLDRKYIDFNLHSFMHHSNKTTVEDFNTDKGLTVSKRLYDISKELQLTEAYGVVPTSYYMAAADYESHDPHSLMRFLENEILPQLEPVLCDLQDDQDLFLPNVSNSRSIIVNTGSVRYDLYKGEFTKNTLFTVSPFKNKWRVIPNVPSNIAKQIPFLLNNGRYILMNTPENNEFFDGLLSPHQRALNKKIDHEHKTTLSDNIQQQQSFNLDSILDALSDSFNSFKSSSFSYGYTTHDDLGSDGDDTIHKDLHYFKVPNVIQSFERGVLDNDEFTDVVFYDFIEPYIQWALKVACGDDKLYDQLVENTIFYNDCSKEFNVGHLLKKYVAENWS